MHPADPARYLPTGKRRGQHPKIRNVEIEDLLGATLCRWIWRGIGKHVAGKTILVTGGGGSIGSELCRQLATFGPAQLILFDIYENNAYDIQQELRRTYPNLKLTVLIGSVRDLGTAGGPVRPVPPGPDLPRRCPQARPSYGGQPLRGRQKQHFGTLNV